MRFSLALMALVNAFVAGWFLHTGSRFLAGWHTGLGVSLLAAQFAWWLVRRHVASREEDGA